MASYDMWYNLLTGLSQGAFDVLEVRDSSGSMQNILTLLGNISSGVSDVQASAPLSVVTNGAVRTLSIDLCDECFSHHAISSEAGQSDGGCFDYTDREHDFI